MILKHRDRELLRFEWIDPQGVRVLSVNEAELRFLPLEMKGQATDEALWLWLTRRTVPKHRHYIQMMLGNLGITRMSTHAIIEMCKGLSLNDVYWVVPDSFKGDWKSNNLYDNEFSKTLAVMAFTGGVHGGIIGYGGITFRFSDGSKIDNFLKDNVVKDMQPLLKKGLKEYFSENADEKVTTDKQLMENLMLSDENNNLIPLPAWTPYPDEKGKGLIFTYQQYEIACYAAGMPSFILTWEELKPFLKDDILKDLNIK
jgi:hypothetical protein